MRQADREARYQAGILTAKRSMPKGWSGWSVTARSQDTTCASVDGVTKMPELLAAVAVVIAGVWSVWVLWRKMQEIADENNYLIAEHLKESRQLHQDHMDKAITAIDGDKPKRKVIGLGDDGELIFTEEDRTAQPKI
jgi:hypothetical protein